MILLAPYSNQDSIMQFDHPKGSKASRQSRKHPTALPLKHSCRKLWEVLGADRRLLFLINIWKSYKYKMQSCGELNILCVGELMAGKSTFLEGYTQTDPSQEHFKVFLRRERKLGCVLYLQEVEDREGGEVYLRGGFDGVLFFVKIDHFHNTARNVLESLSLLSAASGANFYKIPIRAVVISNKNGQDYDDIAPCEQRRFQEEVSSLLAPEQIIFVQSGRNYEKELSDFYGELLEGSAAGIKETTYSNWLIRGATGLLSFDHFKLQVMRLYDTLQEAWLSAVKRSPLKWRDRFLWLGL